ncbi:MAG TPA: metallophosphoesterase [Candidatus Dormibacteraeota bacterium]
MAADDLPVLIVGDVHGDLEWLFKALKPYPAGLWHTIFLGDLVDYGMFGVGALRYARDRPNSEALLGNHEVAMLWALRDPTRVGWWIAVGGQLHDLEELRQDEPLQRWMRERPALMKLPDGTLVQHCGNDSYLGLRDEPDDVNRVVAEQLKSGSERRLWDFLSSPNVFETQSTRLVRYLDRMGARRVAFGHKPHRGKKPLAFDGGKALNFEGAVAPLPD